MLEVFRDLAAGISSCHSSSSSPPPPKWPLAISDIVSSKPSSSSAKSSCTAAAAAAAAFELSRFRLAPVAVAAGLAEEVLEDERPWRGFGVEVEAGVAVVVAAGAGVDVGEYSNC